MIRRDNRKPGEALPPNNRDGLVESRSCYLPWSLHGPVVNVNVPTYYSPRRAATLRYYATYLCINIQRSPLFGRRLFPPRFQIHFVSLYSGVNAARFCRRAAPRRLETVAAASLTFAILVAFILQPIIRNFEGILGMSSCSIISYAPFKSNLSGNGLIRLVAIVRGSSEKLVFVHFHSFICFSLHFKKYNTFVSLNKLFYFNSVGHTNTV